MSGHEYEHPWQHVVSVTEAKSRLGELLRQAEDGEILLVRRSKAAGVLVSNERWWKYLEQIEDLQDRAALLAWTSNGGERSPLSEVEPRRWANIDAPEYDVFVTRECAQALRSMDPRTRLHLSRGLEILAMNPVPASSEPIPGIAGARRFQRVSRRLVYHRDGRELTVVRLGRWLVRPQNNRSDHAKARSAELNRRRWNRLG